MSTHKTGAILKSVIQEIFESIFEISSVKRLDSKMRIKGFGADIVQLQE